jgi:hypothetical protein
MKKLKHLPHLKKHYKAVIKALGYLINNPRHPGLYTREYTSLKGPSAGKFLKRTRSKTPPERTEYFFITAK